MSTRRFRDVPTSNIFVSKKFHVERLNASLLNSLRKPQFEYTPDDNIAIKYQTFLSVLIGNWDAIMANEEKRDSAEKVINHVQFYLYYGEWDDKAEEEINSILDNLNSFKNAKHSGGDYALMGQDRSQLSMFSGGDD